MSVENIIDAGQISALGGTAGREIRTPERPVPVSSQPHRNGVEADPGYVPPGSRSGSIRALVTAEKRGYTHGPESLFHIMGKLDMFPKGKKEMSDTPNRFYSSHFSLERLWQTAC